MASLVALAIAWSVDSAKGELIGSDCIYEEFPNGSIGPCVDYSCQLTGGACTGSCTCDRGFFSIACKEDKVDINVNSNLVGGGGGGPFAVGATYSLGSLTAGGPLTLQNQNEWGSASDVLPSVASFGAVISLGSHSQAGRRSITVQNFYAAIPSFPHSAISPMATGENQLQLRPDMPSTGELDVASGHLHLVVFVNLTNTYYASSAPARARLVFTGTMNPVTRIVSGEVNSLAWLD
jgi:hypothetical protein